MPHLNKTESHVSSKGLSRYELRLKGKLEPGWAGSLCNGLARLKINIIKVEAARNELRSWDSSIEMDFGACSLRPDAIDYIALASDTAIPPVASGAIQLDDYQIEPSRRCGGSLYLEISAPDRLGLLSSLLNSFCLFSLFPAEMRVETNGRRAFDRFWLKGVAGTAPSHEAAETLKERLSSLLMAKG